MARWLRKGLGVTLLGALGAALAYLFDPDRGRSRRSKARDQAGAALRRVRERGSRKIRYAGGRVEGVAARARGAGELKPEDDLDVVQGIRQALSRLDFGTEDVNIEVVDGVATLRGEVKNPDQLKKVESEATGVPGVREVQSYLHLPGTPAPNKASSLRAS